MKLPEHYKKWVDERLEDINTPVLRDGYALGAEAMYHKLMEDE